jgi:hypothetical protein
MTSYYVVVDLSDLLEFWPLMWGLIKRQYVDFHFLVFLHVAFGTISILRRICCPRNVMHPHSFNFGSE